EAIGAAARLERGTKDVGRRADIVAGNLEVGLVRTQGLLRSKLTKTILVVIRLGDGFVKNCRVRGDAADPALLDHPVELAVLEDAAANEVQPDALAGFEQLVDGISHGWSHSSLWQDT